MKKEYLVILAFIAFVLVLIFLVPKVEIPTKNTSNIDQYNTYRFWLNQMDSENDALKDRNKEVQDSLHMYISVFKGLKAKVDSIYQNKKIVSIHMSDDSLRTEFLKYITNDTGNVILELKKSGIIDVLNNLYALDACKEKREIDKETIRKMSLVNIENQEIIYNNNLIMSAGKDTITSMANQMKETSVLLSNMTKELNKSKEKNKKLTTIKWGLVGFSVLEFVLLMGK